MAADPVVLTVAICSGVIVPTFTFVYARLATRFSTIDETLAHHGTLLAKLGQAQKTQMKSTRRNTEDMEELEEVTAILSEEIRLMKIQQSQHEQFKQSLLHASITRRNDVIEG